MAEIVIGGSPLTIIFTTIVSLFGFFAAVACVTLYYNKRERRLRRLEQIQQATEGQEPVVLGMYWSERPIIWEVWADKYPKPTSEWDDLLPLNLTYDHDQPSTRRPSLRQRLVLQAPESRGARWGSHSRATDAQLQPTEPNEGPQSNLATTDCNVSVFIAMPIPHKHLSSEFGTEFAIGTTEVVYRHPKRSYS